jgi:hypothetical protein
MATYIYIDDTGNAQHRSGFKYDTSKSASWCAIILNEKQYDSALKFMNYMSNELQKQLDMDEFHFADIFSAKDIYRNVENRFDIFKDFSRFSALEQYIVILQSFGEDDYKRNKIEKTNTVIDGFKLYEYSDFALFILLLRIKDYLSSNLSYTKPYKIVIDEGRYKNNSYQDCLIFGDLLENKKILYKSSKEEKLLQLADFTAFTLNRCTWLNMKDNLSVYDKDFLQIASDANFNDPFLRKMGLRIDSNRKQIYEKLLDIANNKNQTLSKENLDDFVSKLINKQ